MILIISQNWNLSCVFKSHTFYFFNVTSNAHSCWLKDSPSMRDLPKKQFVLEILSHLKISQCHWKWMKSKNSRGSGSILWAYACILSLVFHHFTIHSFLLTHIPVLVSFTQIWTRIPWHSFPVTGNVSCARLLLMTDQWETLITQARPMAARIRMALVLNGWSDISPSQCFITSGNGYTITHSLSWCLFLRKSL